MVWLSVGILAAVVGSGSLLLFNVVTKAPNKSDSSSSSASDSSAVKAQSTPEEVLDKYFACKLWRERLPLVRDPERVEPLMAEYYKSAELPQDVLRRYESSRKLDGSLVIPVLMKPPGKEDEERKFYWFRKRGDQWQIDWEASSVWNPISWAAYRSDRPTQRYRFRCLISLGDSYNWEFSDRTRWMSIELQDLTSAPGLFAYALRGSEVSTALRDLLNDGKVHFAVVELRFPNSNGQGNCVELVDLVAPGWVVPDDRIKVTESKAPPIPDEEVVDGETQKAIGMMRVMGMAAGAKWASQYGRLPTNAEFAAFLANSNVTPESLDSSTPHRRKMNSLVLQALRDGFEQGCKGVLGLQYEANRPAF